MKAILEAHKIGKVNTQSGCPRISVLSLCNITKGVPDLRRGRSRILDRTPGQESWIGFLDRSKTPGQESWTGLLDRTPGQEFKLLFYFCPFVQILTMFLKICILIKVLFQLVIRIFLNSQVARKCWEYSRINWTKRTSFFLLES